MASAWATSADTAFPATTSPDGCYAEIKDAVRAGQPNTDEEAEFVGLYAPRTRSHGWRSADKIVPKFELSAWEVDAEDAARLAVLMGAGGQRGRFEFLGE